MYEDEMAPKPSSRYLDLAAKLHKPEIIREIDKAFEEMRHEWLDLADLRRSAVRRHGEQGTAPDGPPSMDGESSGAGNAKTEDAKPASLSELTVEALLDLYKSDPNGAYQKIAFSSRENYDALMSIIVKDYGNRRLSEINARTLVEWHATWGIGNKVAVAHAKIGMLRRAFGFGSTILEDAECLRLSTILHNLRFKAPRRRKELLTSDQVVALRSKAHERGRPSIALAQAFQYDLGLRQINVIGQWVPTDEQGEADFVKGTEKWLNGIRWPDIDDNLVLRFTIHGTPEPLVVNLRQSPMVMEELKLIYGFDGDRGQLPKTGPIIINEYDDAPWKAIEFRRWWRLLANACSIPSSIRNMDSRAKIGRRPSQDYEDDPDEQDFENFDDVDEMQSMH